NGYIDIFRSNNHDYSYVMIKDGFVNLISEKILISDLASSGLYGFSSKELLLDNFDNEIYLSEIFLKLIESHHLVIASQIYEEKDTIVLGTPLDYLKQSQILNKEKNV